MPDILNAATIALFGIFGLVAVVGGARELGQPDDPLGGEFDGPGDTALTDAGSASSDEGFPPAPDLAQPVAKPSAREHDDDTGDRKGHGHGHEKRGDDHDDGDDRKGRDKHDDRDERGDDGEDDEEDDD